MESSEWRVFLDLLIFQIVCFCFLFDVDTMLNNVESTFHGADTMLNRLFLQHSFRKSQILPYRIYCDFLLCLNILILFPPALLCSYPRSSWVLWLACPKLNADLNKIFHSFPAQTSFQFPRQTTKEWRSGKMLLILSRSKLLPLPTSFRSFQSASNCIKLHQRYQHIH